jgi:hypothetical protein
MRIRDPDGDSSDPGWKKVGSVINIPDPQHWKKQIISVSIDKKFLKTYPIVEFAYGRRLCLLLLPDINEHGRARPQSLNVVFTGHFCLG